MPERVMLFEGRKFMWDGKTYANKDEAREAEQAYKNNGFETLLHEEGNEHFVYSRRVVTEIVLEGEAVV